jgi:hypothetical protein
MAERRPAQGRARRPRALTIRRRAAGTTDETAGTLEAQVAPDAEDLALASLEAQVRAQEAQVTPVRAAAVATLAVRLPQRLVRELRAEAASRDVTASSLVERAVRAYLSRARSRRRRGRA